MIRYYVHRQKDDGEFATVGTTDITVVTGYRSEMTALRYGILPYLNGKPGRIEVGDPSRPYGPPLRVFFVNTLNSKL